MSSVHEKLFPSPEWKWIPSARIHFHFGDENKFQLNENDFGCTRMSFRWTEMTRIWQRKWPESGNENDFWPHDYNFHWPQSHFDNGNEFLEWSRRSFPFPKWNGNQPLESMSISRMEMISGWWISFPFSEWNWFWATWRILIAGNHFPRMKIRKWHHSQYQKWKLKRQTQNYSFLK